MGIGEDAAITARLTSLRAAYGAAMPEQLGLLRIAARGLDTAAAKAEARAILAGLRAAAHKFAGSAPTFGFTAVGAAARMLERQIGSVLDADDAPTLDDARAIQDAIEELIAEARMARTSVQAGADAAGTPVLVLLAARAGAPEVARLAARLNQAGQSVAVTDLTGDPAAALRGREAGAILVQADTWSEPLRALLGQARVVAGQACPLIFLAGRTNFVARYAASQAGAAGFLADPLHMPDFPARLAALIAPVALRPYRVLHVGTDAPALDRATFDLRVEADPTNLLARLEAFSPELVLLSTDIDGYDAAGLARVIWQEPAHRDIGIFFLARDPGVHRAVAARGVTDAYVIVRPADAIALQARITPYLHDRRAGLRVSNSVDLGPHLARLAGRLGPGLAAWEQAVAVPREQRRRKVLIVDDDRYLVALLAHALTEQGAEVVRAYSGEQGFAAAWKELPSAIISDVEMPNGTGDRMIQQLRANPRTRDIPVIVMTNRRWEDGKDYALERDMRGRLGAAAFLQKPVSPEHLVRELARL